MNAAPIEYKKRLISKRLDYKFYPTSDLLDSKHFKKLKKVRCFAIDKDKKVCMICYNKRANWILPGGTVEKHENPIQALKRELIEEADIEIKNYKLIGFLEFHLHNNETHYDKRQDEMYFVAEIDQVLPQTIDPDLGFTLMRGFFDLEEVFTKYIRYGDVSEYFNNYLKKVQF